jgi:hypothetical protein
MKRHAAPIIAAILLLLPVLYVGSYLVMVDPMTLRVTSGGTVTDVNYRDGGRFAECFFWPLEQVDRKVRPGAWGYEVQSQPIAPGRQLPGR